MEILLIRHGQTDWNLQHKLQGSTDIPLNETGIEQANKCAHYLKDAHLEYVYTSPLVRAFKTAEAISTTANIPLIVIENLREKSFGDAEGLLPEERTSLYLTRPYPNEEPFEPFVKRVMNGLKEAATLHQAEKIACVAHGAVINAILHTISNGEVGTSKTLLNNSSISTLRYLNDQFEIISINYTDYMFANKI